MLATPRPPPPGHRRPTDHHQHVIDGPAGLTVGATHCFVTDVVDLHRRHLCALPLQTMSHYTRSVPLHSRVDYPSFYCASISVHRIFSDGSSLGRCPNASALGPGPSLRFGNRRAGVILWRRVEEVVLARFLAEDSPQFQVFR